MAEKALFLLTTRTRPLPTRCDPGAGEGHTGLAKDGPSPPICQERARPFSIAPFILGEVWVNKLQGDKKMLYRKLGQSDLEVSVITMGCWAIAGDRFWGAQDEADALRDPTHLLAGVNLQGSALLFGQMHTDHSGFPSSNTRLGGLSPL